jgi:NAD+ kinase
MKTVGIIFNPEKSKARQKTVHLQRWLKKKHCKAVVLPSSARSIPKLDFALSLGGDGTILRASHVLAPRGVPILGINLGSLGFLAETDPSEAAGFLEDVLAGKAQIEERMMLDITIHARRRTIR